MSYVDPTVADFRARFPEFSSVTEYPDAVIQQAIDDALLIVTPTSWPESTYSRGVLFLAAHFLFLADQGSGSTAEMMDRLRSISYGPMSLSLAEATLGSGADGTGETPSVYLEMYRIFQPDPWVPIVLDGSHHGG